MSKGLSLLLAVAVFYGGCAAGPYKAIRSGPGNVETATSVVVLDKRLASQFGSKKIVVIDEHKEVTAHGALKIQCSLRNMKNSFLMMQLQTVFRNANGEVVEETPWELFEVPAFDTLTYNKTASTHEAVKYTIRVRADK